MADPANARIFLRRACGLTATDLVVTIFGMKANGQKLSTTESEHSLAMREGGSASREAADDAIDVSLLEDSLAKTPWERMQANDDALRFADALRAAVRTGCKI